MMHIGDALAGPVDPKLLAGLESLRARVPPEFRRELEKLKPAMQAALLTAYFSRQKHFEREARRDGVTPVEAERRMRIRWERAEAARREREAAEYAAQKAARDAADKRGAPPPTRGRDLGGVFGAGPRSWEPETPTQTGPPKPVRIVDREGNIIEIRDGREVIIGKEPTK